MTGTPLKLITFLYEQEKDKQFDLEEHKEKRSRNQNSYAWELIVKLANVLRKSKEEVYLQLLKDYGQSEIVSVRADIDVKGYFKYYSLAGFGEVNGTSFSHYKVYKGTSEYNTKEMSIFIDGLVQECKQQDIETLTPEQIKSMEVG